MDAAGRLQELINKPERSLALSSGDRVALHLNDGEVVEAIISPPGAEPGEVKRTTAKSRSWTRWAGTPDDLTAFVDKAVAEIGARSAEPPAVSIRLGLTGGDEERYLDKAAFEEDIRSVAPGTPGARLRDIYGVSIVVGSPAGDGSLTAKAVFSQDGTTLELEGADRTVVGGLKGELSPIIAQGRPRVPTPPPPLKMFVDGLFGLAYFLALSRMDWNFLPEGILGNALGGVIFLVGFIALVYALVFGMRSVLPPLTLGRPGQQSPSRSWAQRVGKLAGALALAAFPFALERVFG
jgi:hypothetical protein